MTVLEGILLGVLQGLTEFLPVSSSGHLALAEHLLHARTPGVTFEVAVHLATALAVILFFRARIWAVVRALTVHGLRRPVPADARLGWHLLLGTAPAAVVGYLFESRVEEAFDDPRLVSVLLIVTGCILWATRFAKPGGRVAETWRDALVIGTAQAVAVLPGISRSGATISAGLVSGLKRARAAEFAFLLSVPIILGASVASLGRTAGGPAGITAADAAGMGAAFATALPSIGVLMRVVAAGTFHRFAYYCWAVGAIGTVLTTVL